MWLSRVHIVLMLYPETVSVTKNGLTQCHLSCLQEYEMLDRCTEDGKFVLHYCYKLLCMILQHKKNHCVVCRTFINKEIDGTNL